MNKYTVVKILVIFIASSSFIITWQQPKPILLKLPSNFPEPTYNIQSNPLTEEGFALGRELFYDNLLSKDGTISCGSCHQQTSAFVQADHDLSHGVEDRIGKRNALPIFNVLYRKSFFWDGGVPNLDFVPVNPIENELEMDEKMDHVVAKINASEKYKVLFKQAFNVDKVSSKEILQALSQFMYSMISANSKYDHYKREEDIQLTANELDGLIVFQNKCASCHSSDLFTDDNFRNNGLDGESVIDKGREDITLNSNDRAKFKVPSLRNVQLTAPYMHDGRFNSLEEVLDHYSHGVKYSKTLDPLLQKENSLGISLTTMDKLNLIAFLNTLTDINFINNPIFSKKII